MKVSKQGLDMIKGFEGLRLLAYKDSAGIYTIGYGSTRYISGSVVKEGDKLKSEKEALDIFIATLNTFESQVSKSVKPSYNQNQFDALVSLAYNIGVNAFKNSSVVRHLNSGDMTKAADSFLLWCKITDPTTGKKIKNGGLLKRRIAERSLFLKRITS